MLFIKKITVLFILTLAIFSMATPTYASLYYERIPNDYGLPDGNTIPSPIRIIVDYDLFTDLGCSETDAYWWVYALKEGSPLYTYSNTFQRNDTTSREDFYLYLTDGDYNLLRIACGTVDDPDLSSDGALLERWQDTPNFGCCWTLTASGTAVLGKSFVIDNSVSGEILANLSSQLSDTGTLQLLALAGGIGLIFWLITKIVGLLPRNKDDKIK